MIQPTNISLTVKGAVTGSKLKVEVKDLPGDLSQMIIWIINHPDLAQKMIPDWHKLRGEK